MIRTLSSRERQVLAMLATGARQVEIARQLGVSVSTVKTQLRTIKDKTGIESTLQLATTAAAGKIGGQDLQ